MGADGTHRGASREMLHFPVTPSTGDATLGLFGRRTKITADRLGRALFMMAGKSSQGTLPLYRETLELDETNQVSEIEYMLGHVYMIVIAVEGKFSSPLSNQILDGARTEFLETAARAGLNNEQINALFIQRLEEYAEAMKNEAGADPMFHLGSQVGSSET